VTGTRLKPTITLKRRRVLKAIRDREEGFTLGFYPNQVEWAKREGFIRPSGDRFEITDKGRAFMNREKL
jgi:hypothetical protein